MKNIEQLADKLSKRSDYLKAQGYTVSMRVTFTRQRRVRALDDDQAAQFAMVREAKHAPRYFHNQQSSNFKVEAIEITDVSVSDGDAA